MRTIHRIEAGVYETTTTDKDGHPYRITKIQSRWQITDSRGRHVSWHATLADAKGSI